MRTSGPWPHSSDPPTRSFVRRLYHILYIFISIYLTLLYFGISCCSQRQARRRCVGGERGHMTQQAAPKVHTRERDHDIERTETHKSTESKSAYKTTELIVYVLAVLGVLIASMIVDQSFGADPAWRYVTYLTVGYMISRGLAKAGSREPYTD